MLIWHAKRNKASPIWLACAVVARMGLQVIKYESVIHEFDPYFNFHVTQIPPWPCDWRYCVSWLDIDSWNHLVEAKGTGAGLMAAAILAMAFLFQKTALHKCNMAGKPSVATRVLDSMTDNLRPTRAEATDVANG
uniref:pyruvate kinase n=1 Tax=Oryza brachyantha TaxID=4533 RepID=J3LQ35_ORYBR